MTNDATKYDSRINHLKILDSNQKLNVEYWMLMKECYVKGITDSFFNVVSGIVTPNKIRKYKNS